MQLLHKVLSPMDLVLAAQYTAPTLCASPEMHLILSPVRVFGVFSSRSELAD